MGVKECVLIIKGTEDRGRMMVSTHSTHTCTRTVVVVVVVVYTHCDTRTRTHTRMYTPTHTHAHTHLSDDGRLRTSWAESHSCPSSGHVPPSRISSSICNAVRISSSMQPRQNVCTHLTKMHRWTGSRNTRLQAGQTRAGGSSTNLVGLAAISGRRAALPRAREGSRGVGGRGSSLRRTIPCAYPRQLNVRSSRVRVQHCGLKN